MSFLNWYSYLGQMLRLLSNAYQCSGSWMWWPTLWMFHDVRKEKHWTQNIFMWYICHVFDVDVHEIQIFKNRPCETSSHTVFYIYSVVKSSTHNISNAIWTMTVDIISKISVYNYNDDNMFVDLQGIRMYHHGPVWHKLKHSQFNSSITYGYPTWWQ